MNLKQTLVPLVLLLLSISTPVLSQTPELVDEFVIGPKNPSSAPTLGPDGYLYGTSLGGGAYGFGAIYRVAPDGQFQIVASFTGSSGALPGATASTTLTRASDGNLYGVTEGGGPEGAGTVFKVIPGTGAVTLGTFTGATGALPGVQPNRSLAIGADDQLYGTARRGGSADAGTIFKISLSTGAVTHLTSFTGGSGNLPGYYPATTLGLAGDGNLYGTADTGDGQGIIFKVSTTGAASKVVSFTGSSGALQGSGRFCAERLTPDGKGNLYGVSIQGGSTGFGTIFKIVPGAGATSIANLTGTSGVLPGAYPAGGAYLTLAFDGFLYGTTQQGGSANSGVVFRVGPNDVATTIASFTGSAGVLPGATPRAPVTQAEDGNLYGTVRDGLGGGSVFRVIPGGAVTNIGTFTGRGGDIPGNTLETPLVRGSGGNLYGITQYGGRNDAGTVFQVSSTTGLSTVGTFFDVKGSAPRSALTAATDGFLYGTAPEGGIAGSGLIFKIQPGIAGIQPVAGFTGGSGELPGTKPWNRLVATSNGRLYGTTLSGGLQSSGSIFEVIPNGPVQVLTNFGSGTFRGITPAAELARASDGRLFGSASPNFAGEGAFYIVSASGQVTSSTATLDRAPGAALQQAGDGKFYGITPDGGTGFGAVFVLNPVNGTATVLGKFTGQTGILPGRVPRSKLALASDGNLYGTTTGGGASDAGTVFKVTTTGTVVSVASFTGAAGALPGGNPSAALVAADNGDLYGVTSRGGIQNLGTVFRLTPGSSPVVRNVVSFTGTQGALPGSAPLADLVRGPDQNLYGTTSTGGSSDSGTIFQVVPDGGVTTKGSLTGRSGSLPGAMPLAPLALASDSNLYGTASTAGTGGGGTLFRLVFGPTVVTESAAAISFTRSTLNARVNSNSNDSELWFEYGTTPALGLSTGIQVVGAAETAAIVSTAVVELAPDTTYYFRVVGRNPIGTQRGVILTFRTRAAFAPSALSVATTDVGVHQATLSGSVTANGLETTAYFEFGPLTEYGFNTLVRVFSPEEKDVEYNVAVDGLLPHTTYHFRAVATSPAGKGFGEDLSFTTANTDPVGNPRTMHAPVVGAATVVYSTADTSDADGDPRKLTVLGYTGAGSATSDGTEITYTNGGFVGSETIAVGVADDFGGSAVTSVTLRNMAPVAGADGFQVGAGTTVLDVLANDQDPDGDALEITAVSAASGGTLTSDGHTLSYVPGTGFRGIEEFSYTIRDGHGGTASGQVSVMADYSVNRSVAEQKQEVPGSDGAVWTRFGAPSLFAGGTQAGWLATVKTESEKFQGIFSGEIGAPVLRVRSGGPAPLSGGEPSAGVKFAKFQEPVFAGERFAFVGTVSGKDITAEEDTGVWVSEQGALRAIAREGESAPGTNGAKFRVFTSLAMPGEDAAFFVAKLKTGSGGVNEATDSGLWVWSSTGTRLALREGQSIDLGHGVLRVSAFEVLPPVSDSPGHGRYDASEQSIDARLTFTDGSMAIASIAANAAITLVALSGEADDAGQIPVAFGTPSSPGHGQMPVALVTFEPSAGGVTKKDNEAVYDFAAKKILAQKGTAAPGADGGRFASFHDPVAGYGPEGMRVTAFVATLSGVLKTGDVGVWASREGAALPLELVAREGSEPPGAPGTRFKSFQSLSVLEGRGTLFKAKLVSGTSAVKASNDEGLWATDSAGQLRLLIRDGDVIDGKTLQTFALLQTVPGSPGQRRSWTIDDPTATLIYLAYFSDGSSSILTTTIP